MAIQSTSKRAAPPGEQRTRGRTRPSEPMSYDEINRRYEGEWILVKVTAVDERDRVTHGIVLAHDRSRKRLSRAVLRADREEPQGRFLVDMAGARVPTPAEWAAGLRRAAELGPIRASW